MAVHELHSQPGERLAAKATGWKSWMRAIRHFNDRQPEQFDGALKTCFGVSLAQFP
jgi:hypothetical protein